MAALTACASRSMAKSRETVSMFALFCKFVVNKRVVDAKCCADIACLLLPLLFRRNTESMSNC